MKSLASLSKKIWSALNTDITPALNSLVQQVRAIYNPDLEPVIVGGCIVDWVDSRTGEKPWFS